MTLDEWIDAFPDKNAGAIIFTENSVRVVVPPDKPPEELVPPHIYSLLLCCVLLAPANEDLRDIVQIRTEEAIG